MTYTIKKLPNNFHITDDDGHSRITWNGTSWGVFKDGELSRKTSRLGHTSYDVYARKYITQHVADNLNKQEISR